LMVPVFFVSVQRVLAGDREKVDEAKQPMAAPTPQKS
jgi:multidrug efflux pump